MNHQLHSSISAATFTINLLIIWLSTLLFLMKGIPVIVPMQTENHASNHPRATIKQFGWKTNRHFSICWAQAMKRSLFAGCYDVQTSVSRSPETASPCRQAVDDPSGKFPQNDRNPTPDKK